MARKNEGCLCKNKSRTNDKQPSHWGNGMVGEHEVKLSAWPDKNVASNLSVQVTYPLTLEKTGKDENDMPTYSGSFAGIQVRGCVDKWSTDTKSMKAGEYYLKLTFAPPARSAEPDEAATLAEPVVTDDIPF